MEAREALAFDLYGTLVDPIRIWQQLAVYLPSNALQVAEQWRQKQLEFTFRLSVMERYESFEIITGKALDYALMASGQALPAAHKAALLAQYNDLERFADVQPGLGRLQQAGYTMVIFSNGSPAMLAAVAERAQLRPYFSDLISVDAVGIYKPSPRVYRYLADHLEQPLSAVRLISSNPFDLIGAQAVGIAATWLDRSDGLFDPLGPRPSMVVKSLNDLADRLQAPS